MSRPKRKHETEDRHPGRESKGIQKAEKKKRKNTYIFEYGNYNRYYGYRNVDGISDARMEVFQSRAELFHNKDILDIGCNIGHITYLVAREFSAKTVLGIDLDNHLIQIARKNARYYTSTIVKDLDEKRGTSAEDQDFDQNSNVMKFPHNVSFLHSNYVLYHDDLLAKEETRYDTILCLSVTKWIQLNWGDEGLIRVFKRIFLQLRSGGVLVLEAQPFESYKKKKLPMKLRSNIEKIKLLPSMFENYLISVIGFKSCETLAVPSHKSKGFQRPIRIFHKE